MPGVTVKDVCPHAFVNAFAEYLKQSGKIEQPQWVDIAKTGTHKEMGPYNVDWFYVRCAATARHVYVRSPVGVGALTKIFAGGKMRRGCRPNKSTRGSGSVARHALKQLEAMGLVEKASNGGRIISSEGRRDLDRIAGQVAAKVKAEQESA